MLLIVSNYKLSITYVVLIINPKHKKSRANVRDFLKPFLGLTKNSAD